MANNSDYSGVFIAIEMDWHMTYSDFPTLWDYQGLASKVIPHYGSQYNIRLYWGKMSWFNETYTSEVYPRYTDFMAVQEKMDPNCQLVNEFLVDHLGIDRCRDVFDMELVTSCINLRIQDNSLWGKGKHRGDAIVWGVPTSCRLPINLSTIPHTHTHIYI
jgi:hypothetical protein